MPRPTRALLAVLLFVVPACRDDNPSPAGGAEVSVIAVWARPGTAVQDSAAVYFMMTGGDDGDALLGAAVGSEIAAAAEIHETVPVDDAAHDAGDMTGHDMGGMGGAMTMRPVSAVHVGAGQTVLFEPGGFHVMLLDLVSPLEVGAEFDLTLSFEHAGDLTVSVKVIDQ